MKSIEVAAAVIKGKGAHDGQIFAAQRGYGEFKGGWEFPGGKLERGETAEQALKREIKEELAADIEVGERICTVEYDYPTFHLTMHVYWCSMVSGSLDLLEHDAARWLSAAELDSVDWLPADVGIIEKLRNSLILPK